MNPPRIPPYRPSTRACAALLCLLAVVAGPLATGTESPSAPARMDVRITVRPNGGVLRGEASQVVGSTLELRKTSGAVVRIPLDTIESAEFELPENLAAASEAYRLGDFESALPLYEGLRGFESLVRVPGSSIGQEYLDWADTLRQLRRFDKADTVLNSVDLSANKDAQNRAILIRAFIHCDRGEIDRAASLTDEFVPTEANFPLHRIVRTRIHLARGETHQAALTVGESLASTPIESPVYAELLYLAAETYAMMHERAGNPEKPAEQSTVEQLMGESVDYTKLVQGVRQHLTFIFPDSFWARKVPVELDALLAKAGALTLKTPGKDGQTEPENTSASEAAPETTSSPDVWQKFLSPAPTPATNQP
jgi:hypothetical protein